MTLPNWAKLVLGLALVVVMWVMNQITSGALVVPATVGTALAVLKTVLSMLTDGVPTANAMKRARRAAMHSVALLAFTGALVLVACQGCTPSQQGQVVSTVGPSVSLVECVYQHVDGCIQAHTPWTTCTVQTAEACGTDAASVVSIWASKKAAEAREGDAGGSSYP